MPVRRAVSASLARYAHVGVGAFPEHIEQRGRLRAKLAGLIGAAAPEDVALVPGTTRGLIDIATCLDWRPGDRVVVFEGEFPANVTPWQQAAAAHGLELVMLPLEGFGDLSGAGLGRLEQALRGGARLVAVSAVQFSTGLRMPLSAMSALCQDAGAMLCVDAIQACGATPVDVEAEGVDFLVSGGHKWMMGLEGSGFLYAHPSRLDSLKPRAAGWLSHEEGLRFLFEGEGHLRYDRPVRRRVDFLEGGAWNTLGFVAMEAALDLILELGVLEIFEHVQGYLDALEAGLAERGFLSLRARDPAARSCTLSLRPPNGVDVVALHGALGALGVSASIPDGKLRFSPHWPNSLAEVPRVLDAVDQVISARCP
ncbi:MAG: aminotransferase class V-fold PLP-dependent enzyme [Alphaproteobacteria bacterium]|nr:aminotransferase class V-fold PLP-dependent enzyme [Alphaproteobacteria bacterium]